MAPRRPRPCIECGDITTNATRCTKHERIKQELRNERRTHYGPEWTRIAREAKAAQPWCSLPGCDETENLEVDHVQPRSLAQGIQVLCRKHHQAKTAREQAEARAH